jgi:hypothetical protein
MKLTQFMTMVFFWELMATLFCCGLIFKAGEDFYDYIKKQLKKDKSELKCFLVCTKDYWKLEKELTESEKEAKGNTKK